MSQAKKAARLEELLDLGEAQARRVMIGTKETLLPIFHVIYADGTSGVIGTPWESDDEKDEQIAVVKEAMIKGDVVRYSHVSEVWAVFVPAGQWNETRRPSEHPDRYEAVVIVACDLRRKLVRSLRTIRDQAGNCTDLIRDDRDVGPPKGALAGMLDP